MVMFHNYVTNYQRVNSNGKHHLVLSDLSTSKTPPPSGGTMTSVAGHHPPLWLLFTLPHTVDGCEIHPLIGGLSYCLSGFNHPFGGFWISQPSTV